MSLKNYSFRKDEILKAIFGKTYLLDGMEVESIEFRKTSPEVVLNLLTGSKQAIYLIMQDFSEKRVRQLEEELKQQGYLPFFFVNDHQSDEDKSGLIFDLHQEGIAVALFYMEEDGEVCFTIPRDYDSLDAAKYELSGEDPPVDYFWDYRL